MNRSLQIPELSLVLLVGPSGSGKSTFARRHFQASEIISSDYCRYLVSNDENSQDATKDAFEVLRFIAAKRLKRGLLTVIDATNLQRESRKPLLELAREHHTLPVAIVLGISKDVCEERNAARTDRKIASGVLRRQLTDLRSSLRSLKQEGFRIIERIESPEDAESCTVERTRLWVNLRHEHGPFDIIGDIHGCFTELTQLLDKLGYNLTGQNADTPVKYQVSHPEGRRIIFLGDLVDRGPNTPAVLELAMDACESGAAFCVVGNHEHKLLRYMRGDKVQIKHGLQQSVEQLATKDETFNARVRSFIDGLRSHFVLDDGRLVVAHAGLREEMHGRASGAIRAFSMYGETTGEIDEYGLPVRYAWSQDYRGRAHVVYGHTPIPEPEWINRTLNIDTGCVFGGRLTALRYPAMELVDVPAQAVHFEPTKPLVPVVPADTRASDDLLDIGDVTGKRILQTSLYKNLAIPENQAAAALEWMSRFAVDPHWLIYLPPTMSPSETSKAEGYLEYPTEALAYFRSAGVESVICEEKHMGSRAVIVICRDENTAAARFSVKTNECGIIYSRSGRRFFSDRAMEAAVLERVKAALTAANFWHEYQSDWFSFDCEIMPWSLKAQSLLQEQYAAVGAASRNALANTLKILRQAEAIGRPVGALIDSTERRLQNSDKFIEAYRAYCWEVKQLTDIKIAPFHLLASEGCVHSDKSHGWHMETLARLVAADSEIFRVTRTQLVNLANDDDCHAVEARWREMTAAGGEGMVIKPFDFISRGKKGIVQPALKCRGKEYLRIIYGPDYDVPENLQRLRGRSLNKKRSLAMQEFALGLEALDRFGRKEPLYRVHECVFGVMALESEPLDPRL